MTYLIAKYALLFLVAAVVSYLLGRWSVARKFVDVTESHSSLLNAAEADSENWSKLWRRFDELPEPRQPDMGRLMSRIDAVSYAIGKIQAAEPPDLSRLESGMTDLIDRVEALPGPVEHSEVDLQPMQLGMERLSSEVNALAGAASRDIVDLAPVAERLDKLAVAVEGMTEPDLRPAMTLLQQVATDVRDIPVAEVPVPTDLSPLVARLEQVEAVVKSCHTKPALDLLAPIDESLVTIRGDLELLRGRERIDMAPINTELRKLHERLDEIHEPDLKPIGDHLALLEAEMRKLGAKLNASNGVGSASIQTGPKVDKFLKSASYGAKDNLRKIVGIGPVLERLLNKNGVFYYWQIAAWDKRDVLGIDEKLENFRGRIGRDKWIVQARRLSRGPDAAKAPS